MKLFRRAQRPALRYACNHFWLLNVGSASVPTWALSKVKSAVVAPVIIDKLF
jgi:hypothetical protein